METLVVTICFENPQDNFTLILPRCADFAAVEVFTQVLARDDFRGIKAKVEV